MNCDAEGCGCVGGYRGRWRFYQVLAWASYDVTGSSPPSPFVTGVHVPTPPECAGMTFDNVITLTGGNDTIVVPGSSRDLIFGLGGRDTN